MVRRGLFGGGLLMAAAWLCLWLSCAASVVLVVRVHRLVRRHGVFSSYAQWQRTGAGLAPARCDFVPFYQPVLLEKP